MTEYASNIVKRNRCVKCGAETPDNIQYRNYRCPNCGSTVSTESNESNTRTKPNVIRLK